MSHSEDSLSQDIDLLGFLPPSGPSDGVRCNKRREDGSLISSWSRPFSILRAVPAPPRCSLGTWS